MSVMDKLINAMKYNEDDDYLDTEEMDEEDDYYGEEEEPAREPASARAAAPAAPEPDYDEEDIPAQPARPRRRAAERDRERERERDKETSAASRRRAIQRVAAQQNGEVCIIKPTSVNDAREVTDTLLANCTVVLNLEGLDVDVAQRIIDFTSGSCYAVDGNVMKISHYIFVITPANIGVSGDISTRDTEGSSASINAPFGR